MELYEISPLPSLWLKRRSPVQYLARLLLVSYVLLNLLLAGLVRADTPAGNEQEFQSDSQMPTGYLSDRAAFARQMNGTLWVFNVYRDPSDSTLRHLNGTFSSNNGTSWSNITICDSEDPGYEPGGYPTRMIEAHALTNNSIIVVLLDFNYWNSAGKYEVTFLCHWNNSDLSQWERVVGYASSSYSVMYPGSGLNETDKIVFAFRPYSLTHTWVYYFDPDTRDAGSLGVISNKLPISPNDEPKYWLFWNNSDVWNLIFVYQPGSGTLIVSYNVSDLAAGYAWSFWIGTDSYIWDIVLTGNGTYVWMRYYTTGTSRFYWPYMRWYNPDEDTSGADIRIHPDSYWGWFQLGLSNYDNCYVTAVGYNYNTDRFGAWGGDYYEDQTTWQSLHQDYFQEDYDCPNTWKYNFASTAPYQLYPRLESNYTQLPADLGFPRVVFTEYDNAENSNDDWVDLDATWPGVHGWTYGFPTGGSPPEEPSAAFWEWDAEDCRAWSVALVIVMFAIGITGLAGRSL